MRILYPQNSLDASQADEPYEAEFHAAQELGLQCSLFDFDALPQGHFRPKPRIEAGDRVLYRGWMLNPAAYEGLAQEIEARGGAMITSPAQFARCHQLPNWYGSCEDMTAQTHFFAHDANLATNVAALGWSSYFVKDYVKSNTGELGSIAHSPENVVAIVEQIAFYRGEIEGGVAIRRVENYRPDTEQRFFVVKGKAMGPDASTPDLVERVAAAVDAPFFSVDVVENTSGELRLVELGDGQVSEKKNWALGRFLDVIAALAR